MAKSKRSKHMRAMRKLLREKLAKKDEAKRLASLKNDNLIPSTTLESKSPIEEMQTGGANSTLEFNSRTLRNKDGQFPSWLSGRQRKRLQAKQATQKKNDKRKKLKTTTGKIVKRKGHQKKNASVKPEAMLT